MTKSNNDKRKKGSKKFTVSKISEDLRLSDLFHRILNSFRFSKELPPAISSRETGTVAARDAIEKARALTVIGMQESERAMDEYEATIDRYEDALASSDFEFDAQNWQKARDGLLSLRKRLPKSEPKEKNLHRRISRLLRETRKPYYEPLTSPRACILLFIACFVLVAFDFFHFVSLNYLYTHVRCEQGALTINGSTAAIPLVEGAAKDYHRDCGANINVNPASLPQQHVSNLLHGGLYGLAQLRDGQIDIGTSDNFSDTTESGLNDHQVAIAVFALVVNKDVTGVNDLTTDQIGRIYNGDLTNWSQVRQDLDALKAVPLIKISRPVTSEVRSTFEKYILGSVESAPGPLSYRSDDDKYIASEVCKYSGAISYVPISYTHKEFNGVCDLHVLSINEQCPLPDDQCLLTNTGVNNGYPFWNIEHMYTSGKESALALAFIDYMRSDDVRNNYIGNYLQYGYLSIDDVKPDIWQMHSAL